MKMNSELFALSLIMFWAQFHITSRDFLVASFLISFFKSSTNFNEFGLKCVPLEVHRTLARTPAGLRAISLVPNVQDVSGAHTAS
jgi:hypothetical protein